MGHKRNGTPTKASNVDGTGLSERGKKTLAMLTALEEESNMSAWEKEFVASVSDRWLLREQSLTDKQFDCLQSIYSKFN